MKQNKMCYRFLWKISLKINLAKEIKKISFTRISRKKKISEINLTEKVKTLYTESYKTLLKKLRSLNICKKDILCFWIGKTILLRYQYHLSDKQIQCNPFQNFNGLFVEMKKLILKSVELQSDLKWPKEC